MTLSKNQKKSINKKCSSFKGESKSKCIANAKRQYKEAKAKNEQHGKNIDKIENTKINVFPNPTNNVLNIELNGIVVEKISLMDSFGRDLTNNIRHLSRSEDKIILDLSPLSNGLYYLILNDNLAYKIQKN